MHKIVFTGEAVEAAAAPIIQAAAARAIDAVFGRRFKLRAIGARNVRNVYVSVEFLLPNGAASIATLIDADIWEVDRMPTGPTSRAKRVVLSDRAAALTANMGWALDAIERSARLASLSISGDSPVAGFSIPIECVDFRAALACDGSIAVDLIDHPAHA